jgi:hypothetical protein
MIDIIQPTSISTLGATTSCHGPFCEDALVDSDELSRRYMYHCVPEYYDSVVGQFGYHCNDGTHATAGYSMKKIRKTGPRYLQLLNYCLQTQRKIDFINKIA